MPASSNTAAAMPNVGPENAIALIGWNTVLATMDVPHLVPPDMFTIGIRPFPTWSKHHHQGPRFQARRSTRWHASSHLGLVRPPVAVGHQRAHHRGSDAEHGHLGGVTTCQSRPGDGWSGTPSNITIVAPLESAAVVSHAPITQPMSVTHMTRSPMSTPRP